MFRTQLIVALLVLYSLPLSACSAWIDVAGQQCKSDSDCQTKALGDTCVDHVCVDSPQSPELGPTRTQQNASTATQPSSNGHCLKDSDCAPDTPRCMRNVCVSETVAQMFLCREREEPPIDAAPVRYSFKVIEFISREPPGDISARACRTNDVRCTDATPPVNIDPATGLVEFELQPGFMGFFEVLSDALPALSYLTKPILKDTVDRDLQVSAPSTVMALSALDGTEIDPTKGLALLEAFDCTGMPVGGIHFESSTPDAEPFYIVNHVPNHNVKETMLDPDNNVADGGFFNIEPGFVTFTARFGVDGPELGSYNVSVRANTFTFVDMFF